MDVHTSKSSIIDSDKPSYTRVYLAVAATSLLHLSSGAVIAWSSPMIPKLNFTSTEKTLVGSLYSLGAAPGPFIVTLCLDTIGRKGTAYVLWATFVVSWILLLASQDVTVVCIARVIGGIGVGGCCAGIPILISEMAITEIRGSLGSLGTFFMSIGVMIVFAIGPYIGYYILSIYGLTIAVLFFVAFHFVPESPYYYLLKGRREAAKDSVKRLRGYSSEEALEKETQEMERAINQKQDVNLWQSIRTKAAKKSIGIGIFLVLMQQFTGGNPVTVFCQTIFENAKLNFPATIVPIIFTTSNLFGLLSVILVNRCLTVKLALLISGWGCVVFSGLLGLYFYLINNGVDLYNYSFMSVILLFLSNLMLNVALLPLTWPLVAEILAPSIKGVGTGICGFISSLTGFGAIALFSIVAENYGYSTSFFGIAGLMAASTIASIFIVPDTTGKSLQDIQELLSR